MAEAVAALGLAANILQVLDYGSKFVPTCWKIWRSGKDVETFSALQSLSGNLKSVATNHQPPDTAEERTNTSERAIFDTADECRKVAQEISDSLERIGLADAVRSRRKRDAARASFKLIWKSEDIKALDAKFEGVKSQLTLNLAASLRVYAMQSVDQQNEILQDSVEIKNDNRGPALPPRLNLIDAANGERGFGSTVLEYLLHRTEYSSSEFPTGDFEHGVHEAIYNSAGASHVGSASLSADARSGMSPDRRVRLQQGLLSKLHYPEMDDRAETVAEAHKSTFRCIFEEPRADHGHMPWTNFRQWLESSNQLYWITGKDGSGKLTPMKYICDVTSFTETAEMGGDAEEQRCMQYLRKWACGQPLTVASFYSGQPGPRCKLPK